MFDLESSIAEWRNQMLAAGIAPAPLEELEGHLREVIEQRLHVGFTMQFAFESAVHQVGVPGLLKNEFAKVGHPLTERLKQVILSFASVPNYQLAPIMNTTPSNLEPRWATYSKTVTFILPAVILWVASAIFVVPKLKQICQASGTIVPGPLSTAMALSDLFKDNLIVCSALFFCALALLEWRSSVWSRHRRLIFGVAAFTLNSVALVAITAMFILAVLAGSHLLPQTR